jgi:hypothetical protein
MGVLPTIHGRGSKGQRCPAANTKVRDAGSRVRPGRGPSQTSTVVPVPSGYGTSRLSWSVLPRSYSSPCFPESSSYVDCVHNVLRTLPAIIRPIPGIKPVSGHLVIIHLCIRASTHRLRSYQTFSSADYHYIGIGEEP